MVRRWMCCCPGIGIRGGCSKNLYGEKHARQVSIQSRGPRLIDPHWSKHLHCQLEDLV
jgi:hypothetical protein